MKKILVLLVSVLLSIALYAQEKNTLVISLTNGSLHTFRLSEKPIITLPDGYVVVNGSAETTYLQSEVEKFYFVDIPDGIDSVNEDNVTFNYRDGENVQISGLKENTSISVATLDGKILFTQKCDKSGKATISLGSHSQGVYIISFGGRSIKIKK